jgi:hypothetical protein
MPARKPVRKVSKLLKGLDLALFASPRSAWQCLQRTAPGAIFSLQYGHFSLATATLIGQWIGSAGPEIK